MLKELYPLKSVLNNSETGLFVQSEYDYFVTNRFFKSWIAQFNYVHIQRKFKLNTYWLGFSHKITAKMFLPYVSGEYLTAEEIGQLLGGN